MSTPTLRPFTVSDEAACLAIFDSNCPEFLDPSERADYEEFLVSHATSKSYMVIEQSGDIVAGGGIAFYPDDNTGWFCWGLVKRDRHNQGLGRQLTRARIDLALGREGIIRLELDTSQKTKAFYESFGFVTKQVTENGYGPGLDRYDMVLSLSKT